MINDSINEYSTLIDKIEELEYHRMTLFSILVMVYSDRSWKSKIDSNGNVLEDGFIVGITTKQGNFCLSYEIKYWGYFKCQEVPQALKYDDFDTDPTFITRLYSLLA